MVKGERRNVKISFSVYPSPFTDKKNHYKKQSTNMQEIPTM
jgi:hypothetical protein